jgi:hypothetical protein
MSTNPAETTPTTEAPSIVSPRVGGTSIHGKDIIPWTGGSNIPSSSRNHPASLLALRPEDFKSAKSTEASLKQGADEAMWLFPADDINKVGSNKISLMSWMELIRREMEERGMDTVFRIPKTGTGDNLDDSVLESYLFSHWGEVSSGQVRSWVSWLSAHGDYFDKYNLTLSFKMIQSSISIDMWRKIEKTLSPNPSGPELLTLIIEAHQVVSASAVRVLVSELEKLNLNEVPAENVEDFSDSIMEKARVIQGTGQAPRDLCLIIAARYLKCSVLAFTLRATSIHDEADMGHLTDWQNEIVMPLKLKYRSLKQQGLWPPSHARKEPEVALKADIQQLTQRIDGMNRGDAVKCFQCGEPGHVKTNCPHKKDTAKRDDGTPNPLCTPPKDGESHTKVVKGETQKWCKRCRRWTTGARIHLTDEHIVGFKRAEGETKTDEATESANLGGIDTSSEPPIAAGNLAFIPTFAHIGGFMGAFADPEEGSVQSIATQSPYDEHGPAMGTQHGTDTTQVVQLGTASDTPMSTGLTGSVAGLTASTATRFDEQNFSGPTQVVQRGTAMVQRDTPVTTGSNQLQPPLITNVPGVPRDKAGLKDDDNYDDSCDYNKDYYDAVDKLRQECEFKAYDDFSSSDSEWEPYGGYVDPSLSPRSESNRLNLNKTKRYYKTKAWEVKEATKRGHELAMTAPNHRVARSPCNEVKEGIINPSGVVEPFAAPGQQLVFLDSQHESGTNPEPDPDDDDTFHSTTTQPKALIGFITHDDEAEDSLATPDDGFTIVPPLEPREDLLSDDDETLDGPNPIPGVAGPHPDDVEMIDVDGNDDVPWIHDTNGRTRRRLNDGSYSLPQKVATIYGICQSALTWMSLKDDAGQL